MGSRKLKNAIQALIDTGYLQRLVEETVRRQLALSKNLPPLVQKAVPEVKEKRSPPTKRKSPRNKEVVAAPSKAPEVVLSPILADDSDVIFYGINSKMEAVGPDYLLISTREGSVNKLHEVRNGVTVSSATLMGIPSHTALTKDGIAVACKGGRGYDVYFFTLPLKDSVPHSFTSIQAIAPSLKIACTSDATYCADKNEELYDLMSLRTRWPAGRALIDNESSLFVVSVTRLRRILKSKESGIPTWEHILLTEATNLLACSNEHIIYSYGTKMVSVKMTGEAIDVSFKVPIRSIALGPSICYVLTEDAILSTLEADTLNLISQTALEEYVSSTTLFLSGTSLYYTTSYSIRRFTLH